jgi:hypothetical protein
MRQLRFAGVGSTFPAASRALTRKTCLPSPRFLYVLGERQAPHRLPSSLHSKVEPGSLEPKRSFALWELVLPEGPD